MEFSLLIRDSVNDVIVCDFSMQTAAAPPIPVMSAVVKIVFFKIWKGIKADETPV